MTEAQREIYQLLLLTGRTEEAENFRRRLDSHGTMTVPENNEVCK